MNILQLVPKLNVGGVEKGTVEVARYLTLNGHKAVVISGGGVLEKKLAAIGARHYQVPVGRKNPFVMVYSYFKIRRIIIKENIDIVHARSRIPALIGYFAAKFTHRTFLTTAHGQYRKHLISRVMGWGKLVIVANETMARYMKENFDVPLRKTAIVPRGVDLKRFSFTSPNEKRGKVFRVGMISRFTPLKGHLDFLKAMSYVSRKRHNVEIILMGDKAQAKEEYIKKIELTVRRLMLSNIVKFKTSDEDVAHVMKNLDVLVSANTEQEAFGRSVIEAQASGLPVVATRVGGVVENVIDDKTGLLCEPGNPQDMADRILDYAQDPGLMERIAEGARKHVEERYSIEKTMQMTLQTYSRALSSKNILIFKISSLGDIILSVPSLRAIRKRFPAATIKVLIDVKFREVLERCPYIDEVISCDLAGRDKGLGLLKLAGRLRSEDFDISIDFQNNRKSHLLAFLSSIQERYGYHNGKWSVLLNRRIALPVKPMPPVEHQGCVLGLLGITTKDKSLELWPSAESEEWADKFLEANWLKKSQRLVAISLAASRRWESKNWGIAQVAELADMLAKEKGIRGVLVGLEEDRSYVNAFSKKSSSKPIDAVGKTDFSKLISLIKRCDALLTGDSAPMHVAAAEGTPFVAIFGPTDPDRHLPQAEKKKVIHKNIKCAPCYKPTCRKNMKCMSTVKPQEVFEALEEVMKSSLPARESEITPEDVQPTGNEI